MIIESASGIDNTGRGGYARNNPKHLTVVIDARDISAAVIDDQTLHRDI